MNKKDFICIKYKIKKQQNNIFKIITGPPNILKGLVHYSYKWKQNMTIKTNYGSNYGKLYVTSNLLDIKN